MTLNLSVLISWAPDTGSLQEHSMPLTAEYDDAPMKRIYADLMITGIDKIEGGR